MTGHAMPRAKEGDETPPPPPRRLPWALAHRRLQRCLLQRRSVTLDQCLLLSTRSSRFKNGQELHNTASRRCHLVTNRLVQSATAAAETNCVRSASPKEPPRLATETETVLDGQKVSSPKVENSSNSKIKN